MCSSVLSARQRPLFEMTPCQLTVVIIFNYPLYSLMHVCKWQLVNYIQAITHTHICLSIEGKEVTELSNLYLHTFTVNFLCERNCHSNTLNNFHNNHKMSKYLRVFKYKILYYNFMVKRLLDSLTALTTLP